MGTATTKPRASSAGAAATGPKELSAPPPQKAAVEQVRARAYEIYQARTRNGGAGDETSDWLQAEHELTRKTADLAASIVAELKLQPGAGVAVVGGD